MDIVSNIVEFNKYKYLFKKHLTTDDLKNLLKTANVSKSTYYSYIEDNFTPEDGPQKRTAIAIFEAGKSILEKKVEEINESLTHI